MLATWHLKVAFDSRLMLMHLCQLWSLGVVWFQNHLKRLFSLLLNQAPTNFDHENLGEVTEVRQSK